MHKQIRSVTMLTVFLFTLLSCSTNSIHQTDEIKPKSITQDTSVGVGTYLNYADNSFIIFQGEFGLFGYDLTLKKVTFAVDLETAVGATAFQGLEDVAAVNVTLDGSVAQVYATDDNSETYYINTHNGSYYIAPYKQLEAEFDPLSLEDGNMGVMGSTNPLGTVGTLGELCFYRNGEEWLIFANYFD